jgi:hypothetical protein
MIATLEEHPCSVAYDILCDWNYAGLGIRRRLEDLMRQISIGGENNKSIVLYEYNYHETGTAGERRTYLWKTETQLRGPLAHCLR